MKGDKLADKSDVKLDIEEALEAASKADKSLEGSSTEEGEETVETADDKGSQKGKGAQDRIRELVAKSKELEEKFEKTNGTLTERDAEISKLLDLLQSREEDSRVVKRINDLYQDDKHKPYIEYLDKIVKGEEPDKAPEFSSNKVQKGAEDSAKILNELNNTKAELETAMAEQRAELILDKADQFTDSWLKELPKEYTPEDKQVMQELLVNRVDWDGIEEADGKNLKEKMTEAFQKTLDQYGKPRGLNQAAPDTKEKEKETPEEVQMKLRKFIDQPWGELETDAKGVKTPKVSEDQFTQALAQLLKRQNTFGR